MNYIIAINPLRLVDRDIAQAQAAIVCPYCHQSYPLRPNPIALATEAEESVIVRPGYLEVCPLCLNISPPGTALHLTQQEETPAN